MTSNINTFKKLDDIFNTAPPEVEPTEIIEIQEEKQLPVAHEESQLDFPTESDLHDDFQTARRSLQNLLSKGEHVVDNMLAIAAQTESARSFEVAGNLIKTMADVAKDLVNLHKATNDAKRKTGDQPQQSSTKIIKNTQNNIVFKGNTNDLFDMIDQDK